MIIPIWQKIGQSSHLLAQQVGKSIAIKTSDQKHTLATHTGTLDPMAEGVLIVLTAEDRYKKAQYANYKKEYEFSVLFGITTDSYDLLGLQTKIHNHTLNLDEISSSIGNILPKFVGTFEQTQPAFSAQRVAGKSAFDRAKRGEATQLKSNIITISSLKLISRCEIPVAALCEQISSKINTISGDFRQDQIQAEWKKTIEILTQLNILTLPLVQLKAVVSKRTYVRSLVNDLAKMLDIPATTFHIVRTKNGQYSQNSCENLL